MATRRVTETGVFVIFLRSLRAWSQAELAAAAGIDQRMISRYELGEKIPRDSTLERLAGAVGLPFAEARQMLPCIRRALAAVAGEGGSAGAAGWDTASLAQAVSTAVRSAAAELHPPLVADAESTPLSPGDARRRAGELWEFLKDRPVRDGRVLVEGASEYQSRAFAERLCEESGRAAAAGDAVRALELASLAARAAELAAGDEATAEMARRPVERLSQRA